MEDIQALKKELRADIRRRKTQYTPLQLAEMSAAICEQLERCEAFVQAHTVLLYHALPDEVQTQSLLNRWAAQKTLLLPVVTGDTLVLRKYYPGCPVEKNQWGIPEPVLSEDFTHYASIQLAVIPGMAFDAQGHRLGRGKGYYDRLLPALQCPVYGICFPFQRLDHIPSAPWDIPVDRVISD